MSDEREQTANDAPWHRTKELRWVEIQADANELRVLNWAAGFEDGWNAAAQRAEQAEAQVLALREALDLCNLRRGCDCGCIDHDEHCDLGRALNDTAAAAEAVRKRIELEAVRAFVESVQARMAGTNSHALEPPLFDVCGRCLKAELAALEAEHA